MTDGVKILVAAVCFNQLQLFTGIKFTTLTDLRTGEIICRRHKASANVTYTHTGFFGCYKLTVLETHINDHGRPGIIKFNLIIEGSFHKNHFSGQNYERFTFSDMQEEVTHLCRGLDLHPDRCIIQNLEAGVNISTPFDVTEFINDSAIMHRTKAFISYSPDSKGMVLGRYAKHSQHSVKIYDKGLQYGLTYPLMRFEDRCIKMQYLAKYNIRTLTDLFDYQKVKALGNTVIGAWDNVLLCNPAICDKELDIPDSHRQLLREGCYRDFWTQLHKRNRKAFNKKRTQFKKLTVAYGQTDLHKLIREMIVNELKVLFAPNVHEEDFTAKEVAYNIFKSDKR